MPSETSKPVSQTTAPSEAEIAIKMAADPISAAAIMCRQEDKLIAAEKEIKRLKAEIEDLRCSVIAFGAPAMVEWARDQGLPRNHLYPEHYDILKRAGARMDDFTRAEVAINGR